MDAGMAIESLPSLAQHGREPKWANIKYPPINYQDIIYYSAPKQKINAEQPG